MVKASYTSRKNSSVNTSFAARSCCIISGNPAIAVATTYVAKATHEEMIAQQEYQKARENRINMHRRVEIVKHAKCHINTLYEQTRMQLNNLYMHIDGLTQIIHSRLLKGDLLQKDYLSQSTNE